MRHPTHKSVVERVTAYYLNSSDFNGYPSLQMETDFGLEPKDVQLLLERLVKRGRICIVTPHEDNPHIKRFPDLAKQKQLELLASLPPSALVCVYPSRSHLRKVVSPQRYAGRPFSLELAHAEAQLAYRVFDLTVLETYTNDPRYAFYTNDIEGHISISSHNARRLRRSDQNLLESFGFAYNKRGHRAVAAFLRYLGRMTPAHQQVWNAKRLRRASYGLHPDYYRTSILGEWTEGISIFDAVLGELQAINDMAALIENPPLFKDDFRNGRRPQDFGFLLRPTLSEFNKFVHLTDKMLSENINRDFFGAEVSKKEDVERNDGRIEVRQKGTIRMLQEWIEGNFRSKDPRPITKAIEAFKHVRRMRQKPAHTVDQNIYDQQYIRKQRDLMREVYPAVQILRLMLTRHPKTRSYKISSVLTDGRIWEQ